MEGGVEGPLVGVALGFMVGKELVGREVVDTVG